MRPTAKQILETSFSHREFRPGQEEVINLVLKGENALALFPTGSGKSLCYQLPALALDGLTLVISPLLALIQDQVDGLQAQQISASRLDSSLSIDEQREVEEMVKGGRVKILFLSPERLNDQKTHLLFKQTDISLVAIDEAHCFSQWGHSFRPDYRRLPQLIKSLRPNSILALTATATRKVSRDIRQFFKIPAKNEIRLSYVRPNLDWKVSPCLVEDKVNLLVSSLKQADRLPAIVYCSRQVTTETVAHALSAKGMDARSFHAGMPSSVRRDILNGFLNDEFPIIVATIAFGMGVDKPNVRSVIHYEAPRSPSAWLQEAGRAGRDGDSAHTEVLVSHEDFVHHENIGRSARPSRNAIERILRLVFSGEKDLLLSPYLITTQLDVSRQVLDTILTSLEIDRMISKKAQYHRKVAISPLRPIEEVLSGLSRGKRQAFKVLFERRSWQDLFEYDSSPKYLSQCHEFLTQAELAEDLAVKRSHQLHHYKVLRLPSDLSQIVEKIEGNITSGKNSESSDLEIVKSIFTSKSCIQKSLVKHLGERSSLSCGRCSRCLNEAQSRLKGQASSKSIEDRSHELISAIVGETLPSLSRPEQLTRHLLGITSPAARTARLYLRDTHGLLSQHSWEEVLALSRAKLG